MISLALFATLLATTAAPDCQSTAECNRLGTQALSEKRFDDARHLFARQNDYADTALRAADTDSDTLPLESAREYALNNAALTELRAGECLMARAWLEVADASHKATAANRQQWDKRCGIAPASVSSLGEFRQYAGHGAWNRIALREADDGSLTLDAFWMRIGRGPLDDYGPAAFGDLTRITLHREGDRAHGRYDGHDPEQICELQLRFLPGALEIQHTEAQTCHVGGAGALLRGTYLRTAEQAPEQTDDDS